MFVSFYNLQIILTIILCSSVIDFPNSFIRYTKKFTLFNRNYLEKCPVRIWKRYIPLLIDLSISNNFSSMTFFAQRVFYELLVVKVYDSQPIFLLIFWHNKKKNK